MKIFAVAVLVVIAGDSQAMGACTDTLPEDLATYNCQHHTCMSLAVNHCGNTWGTCSKATGAIRDYCRMSCGNCPPTCNDGLLNQDEVETDCGGTICPPCRVFGCPNDKIALKSYHGKYVVAEEGGGANANRAERNAWEIFTVEEVSAGKIALRSHHGKYLVAESSYEVNADRDTRGAWEVFEVLEQPGGTVAFKTAHGRYLVAEKDGRLRGDRTKIDIWENFTPECINE